MFFAAYVGPSMIPTLREPEIMEVVPYGGRSARAGDVVFFLPPEADQPVVHRVVRVTPAGLSTRGDNNSREDAFLVKSGSIRGQVVAAWRGQKRRTIAGGLQGRLAHQRLRWRLGLYRGVSPVLQPIYQALSRRGLMARLLPSPFRPRVIVFHTNGRDQFQLLLRKRVIGRYDDRMQRWQIQPPFHLLVDGRALPGQQEPERANRPFLTERNRTIDLSGTPDVLHTVVLADGIRWEIAAGDQAAASIVSQLGCAMQLPLHTGATEPLQHAPPCRLLVRVDTPTPVANCYVPTASRDNGLVVVRLDPCEHWGSAHVNLARLSLILARESQARGGVLIHGALAERDGMGVILTAPGGTGKTTASNRLPAPWRSLCDDTTLVVKDPQGRYMAHPWPTWSRFRKGGPGGSWDVQHAVPIQGIFILAQAAEDRAQRIGPGQAVSLLVECVRQASQFMPLGLFKEEIHALHLERFNNLCAVAQAIPVHTLHLSLTGAFWKEIERSLEVCAP